MAVGADRLRQYTPGTSSEVFVMQSDAAAGEVVCMDDILRAFASP